MEPDDQNDPLIGTKLGPCRIEKRLAAGGMGVVYRARHTSTDEDVAVKILAPSLSADQEYVNRFFREAGAAGQIDHPNVVRVMDVGKQEDKYYLIMEYVAGETLDQTIEREHRVSLERSSRLIREVASGLAAAHRAGIIHRDVKPGNIIVSRDGKPHLTDFGLAKLAETRKGLTIEGTFLGTPEYASPEQVEGRRLDHRTDLYSLGVTYYQLMSGTLPFLGESPMEMAIKRTKDEPRPLESAFPTADPRACAITARLLKQDAGQRYQSATELIKDLDAILTNQQPATATLKETKKLETGKITVQSKRFLRGLVYWGLVGAAVLLGFCSGALTPPGGDWSLRDGGFGIRVGMLLAALLGGGGAVFIWRREFAFSGRTFLLAGMTLLMVLGAMSAGIWLEDGGGTVGGALRALAGVLSSPVNILAFGALALILAAQISYEHEPGTARVILAKFAVVAFYLLSYAFGTVKIGLGMPFESLLKQAELSIPLGTATVLAAIFGFLMLTNYNFENGARTCGLILAIAAGIGLIAFGVLVGQPSREGWLTLLGEPFTGIGPAALRSGTSLAGVLALGVAVRGVVVAGLRQQDRFYKKR